MKKLMLLVAFLIIVLPLSSFKSDCSTPIRHYQIKLKKFDHLIGYFYIYGHEYTAVGTDGGTSGEVTSLYEDGTPVTLTSDSNTWSYSYGLTHDLLGVSVYFIKVNSSPGSYFGYTTL